MNVYGITGTNGKTTTTWVLAEFLRPLGRVGHVTTVEVDTGARTFSTGYTTPPNKVLMEIFAEMEANGLANCVMEVSSHAIHQNRTAGTRFAGGAFTNLSEDHLDYHKTMEAYFAAKRLFFERLAAENPGAPAVVCVDGDWGRRLADELAALPLRLVTYHRPFTCRRCDTSEARGVPIFNHQGGVCAGPTFSTIASFVLRYLAVEPDVPEEVPEDDDT